MPAFKVVAPGRVVALGRVYRSGDVVYGDATLRRLPFLQEIASAPETALPAPTPEVDLPVVAAEVTAPAVPDAVDALPPMPVEPVSEELPPATDDTLAEAATPETLLDDVGETEAQIPGKRRGRRRTS